MKKRIVFWTRGAVCLLLMAVMSMCCVQMLSVRAEETATAPGVYLIYADIQAEKTILDSSYDWYCYPATHWRHQLPTSDAARGVSADGIFYLAQNEREGIQLYFTEPETSEAARQLRVEVSEFRNAGGELLPAELFREEYVTPSGVTWSGRTLYLADPLVPYQGEAVAVEPANNQVFYLETRSAAAQTPGAYYATVTYSDDTGVIGSKTLAAVVWDFALPQQHYATMTVGLYNSASGYGATSGFLRQNGVRFDASGAVLPEDQAKADAILAGWQEYLLDHGISPFEIPRDLIDTDPKAAELAMADVRRKRFFVPLLDPKTYNGAYSQATVDRILQYRSLIGDHPYLMSKAALYTMNEVNPIDDPDFITGRLAAANSVWPEIKKMLTYNGAGGNTEQALTVLKPEENIVCVNTATLTNNAALNDAYLSTFCQKWRYPAEIASGGFELWRWRLSTVGPFRRMVFWQQHNQIEDCVLYWNCAYLVNNANIWNGNVLPAGNGVSTGNGNGLLLYAGLPIGQPAETPIGSLRVKQIAAGIDDMDYLELADEFLPEADRPTWKEKTHWTVCDGVNNNRVSLGNKLEAAVGSHSFGAWQTVVEPDARHNGLELRHCENCGTEESRAIPPLAAIGDADCSGTVDIADVTAIQRYFCELDAFSEEQLAAADTNGDGVVNIADATHLQMYLAGYLAALG